MHNNKVIRSICYFTTSLEASILEKVEEFAKELELNGYLIQTKRICSQGIAVNEMDSAFSDPSLYLSVGSLDRDLADRQLNDFLNAQNVAFNLDLSSGPHEQDTNILFKIIQSKPGKTFNFTYTFNNVPSSPYFPSATYQQSGFSIGLQPTDLSENCKSIDEWLHKMRSVWDEILDIFKSDSDFLGIDSSIAPLFTGNSSLVHFIKKLYDSFSLTVTKDLYLKINEFIKTANPKPVGLCGIMLPCLEDFELAEEYRQGNFTIERNIYLSLHSGLGIDTYPIGIDEAPERVFEILCLLQGLSQKYNKPLSARFVSDGRAKIGDMTDFKNQYLKDVVVRSL
jgi:hypothetical protein